jgi:hypothetical protein
VLDDRDRCVPIASELADESLDVVVRCGDEGDVDVAGEAHLGTYGDRQPSDERETAAAAMEGPVPHRGDALRAMHARAEAAAGA